MYDDAGFRIMRCEKDGCEKLATWGFEVRLLKDFDGVWFCHEHALEYDKGAAKDDALHGDSDPFGLGI